MTVKVYDRATGTVTLEHQYGEARLRLLYSTVVGRWLLGLVFSRPWYSRLSGYANATHFSARKIKPFIDAYRVDMADYPGQTFSNFGAFFRRQPEAGRRPVSRRGEDLIAVADSKLLVYPIDLTGAVPVKHSRYTVAELVQDQNLAARYEGGTCLVYRLSIDDCHRYIFVDNGYVIRRRTIAGRLHTIRPIATKRYRAFSENYRQYSVLNTAHFGEVVVIEVGALLVGHITNHPLAKFRKGQEKGYFGLGGSTIIVLIRPDIVDINQDILTYSTRGIEIKVKMGETIGVKR